MTRTQVIAILYCLITLHGVGLIAVAWALRKDKFPKPKPTFKQ